MRKILVMTLAVASCATIAVSAGVAEGTKFGVGYFRPETPIGARVWFNDKMGFDLGAGFANQDVPYIDNSGSTTVAAFEKKTSWAIDAGLPWVLLSDETTRFFVRPGITYTSIPVWDSEARAWARSKMTDVAGSLGVEHWFGKRFSLGVGHGIIIHSVDPGTKGSKTTTSVMTEAMGITSVGFHFYLN